MTPRDYDDARSDDQPVDRPEDLEMEDEEAEPTVTRLSRADVRKYEQGIARASDFHPKPAQPEAPDDDSDWHEVNGGAGSDAGEEPRSQPTPPRDPDAAESGRSDTSPDTDATQRLDPVAVGGPDEKATQILDRAEETQEPPTVVSQGPLVSRRPGAAPGNHDRSTRVMATPAVPAPTGAGPGRGAAGATGAAAAAAAGTTAAGRATDQAEQAEAEALAERRAEREARDRSLGRRRPQPVDQAVVEPPSTRLPRTTDRFPASLGLFLLRLAVAAVLGVRGAQQLMDIPGTTSVFTGTALPYPEIFAWATAVASVLIAVALVLGLSVRLAGLGAALVGIGALVYVYWWRSPFESGVNGFRGETELLLAVLGVFLLLVGGGAWGIDAAIRKRRLQRKAEKFEAEQV